MGITIAILLAAILAVQVMHYRRAGKPTTQPAPDEPHAVDEPGRFLVLADDTTAYSGDDRDEAISAWHRSRQNARHWCEFWEDERRRQRWDA